MNNCSFIGRLTKDPDIKLTGSGKKVLNFSIAVDRGYKDSQGNRVADFIPCVAWDGVAVLIADNFSKGNNIGITGKLESSIYQDGDKKRTSFYILVSSIDFIQGIKAPKNEEVKEELSEDEIIQNELNEAYSKELLVYEDGEGSPFDV